MPAMFDPVRDAVANSPRTPSYPLPSPSPLATHQPLHTPTSAHSTAFPFPPVIAPSSSDVAQPRPPPPTKRPSSLSMLLNGGDEPPAKNQRLASLMSPAATEMPLPPVPSFSVQERSERRPGSSSSTSSQPHPLRSSYASEHDTEPSLDISSPSPTHSVSPSRPQSRLPSHQSTSSPGVPPKTSPSAFPRPKLPYHPRRITPAASVLRPLTAAEMATWVSQNPLRNALRPGQQRPSEKDRSPVGKRGRDTQENEQLAGEPSAKRSKDVGLVVQHYNARPDVGVDKRQESPIIGLKSFNNWIKSVLISKFAVPVCQSSPLSAPEPTDRGGRRPPPVGKGKVLDMGCGKGGDLQKWSKAKIAEYVGVDIAALSVDQAYHRWLDMQSRKGATGKFDGEFASLDCYVSPLAEAVPPKRLLTPFDAVSLQFCMHYAFESEFKVRTMLDNVTKYLRVGGVFIGTTPNGQQLMEKLADRPDNDLSWGNAVYTVRFDDKVKRTYGQRYSFFLKDAVDDVPEYVVHWDNFQQLAATYNLMLVYKQEFHEIFEQHEKHAEFGPLLQKMKVVDANGESHMDEDQWEAANVYLAFAFVKVAPAAS